MRTRAVWLLLPALSGAPASAHHSFYGVYAPERDTAVEGVVTGFRFVNPHPFLDIDVIREDGSTESWELEMDNRGELARIGITAETFKPGDRVLARGSLALQRNQSMYMWRLDRPADGLWYEQRGTTPYTGRASGQPDP
jgi:hypothetical protein